VNIARELVAGLHVPAQVRHRILPAQPSGTPVGSVYCGIDLGFLPYDGPQPQPGDVVIVMEERGRKFVRSQQAVNTHVPALTAPTFNPACLCKCPPGLGVAFYMQSAARNSFILALDALTGSLVQVFGLGDLWYGRGIAVDNSAPYDLYVLDDRRILKKVITTTAPNPTRGYFTLVKFVIGGGQYGVSSYVDLVDPFPTPLAISDFPGIGVESQDTDPPNFTRQGLSVIEGTPHLTLYNAPARYLTFTGSTISTVSLTQNGAAVNLGLRGQIVTIPDRPAKKANRYCLATDGTGYQLLQFGTTGGVSATLALDAEPQPAQLATVCNQLLVLSTDATTLVPSTENTP
jgi:hypothetical protein